MHYVGDLVNIKVDNNGNTPEYISFQLFFPKHIDISELNSKISGVSDEISSNEQPSSMLQQLSSFAGSLLKYSISELYKYINKVQISWKLKSTYQLNGN